MRRRTLKRREATQLLREIASFPEAVPLTCVLLKPDPRINRSSQEDLELYIKTDRDASTRKVIEHLAQTHGLTVSDQSDGFLVVHSPVRDLLEITA